jgi:predicted DNA binding CopG/RHH family protein
MRAPLPVLTSDEDAERFIDEADFSQFDWSVLKPTRFAINDQPGRDQVSVSVDRSALNRAVERASERAIPLDRYLGEIIERALAV